MQASGRIVHKGAPSTLPLVSRPDRRLFLDDFYETGPHEWIFKGDVAFSTSSTPAGHPSVACQIKGIPIVRVSPQELSSIRGYSGDLFVGGDGQIQDEWLGSDLHETKETIDRTRFERVQASIFDLDDLRVGHLAQQPRNYFLREEFLWASGQEDPTSLLDRQGFPAYADRLTENLSRFCEALPGDSLLNFRLLDYRPRDWNPLASTVSDSGDLGLHGLRHILADERLVKAYNYAFLRLNPSKMVVSLPFVTDADEFQRALDAMPILRGFRCSPFCESPGMMMQAAAALAQTKDGFIFVGMKDLTQFFLASSRTDADTAYLYDMAHPALVRFLELAFDEAGRPKDRTYLFLHSYEDSALVRFCQQQKIGVSVPIGFLRLRDRPR